MKQYKIFLEGDDEYLVEMTAYEKEFRDLKLRILAAINTGLKVLDLYLVDNKMKKINKSQFKKTINEHLSDKGISYITECYRKGQWVEIEDHMMERSKKKNSG